MLFWSNARGAQIASQIIPGISKLIPAGNECYLKYGEMKRWNAHSAIHKPMPKMIIITSMRPAI